MAGAPLQCATVNPAFAASFGDKQTRFGRH
jgi:hypothetical protein